MDLVSLTFPFKTHCQQEDKVVKYLNGLEQFLHVWSFVTEKESLVFTITITGPHQVVLKVKRELILSLSLNTSCRISLLPEVMLSEGGMRKIARKKLEELKATSLTEITLLPQQEFNRTLEIEIEGLEENVEKSRLSSLVLLDELLGLHVLKIDVEQKLHAIVNGRNRSSLNTIMHSTNTLFYFPFPLFTVQDSLYASTIYITGLESDCHKAATLYMDIVADLETKLSVKTINCQHRKLDWLYGFKKPSIRKIMKDNGVDIQFPNPTSGGTTISVTGTRANLVDRAIRSLKQLICDCYLASIQTLNVLDSPDTLNRFYTDVTPLLHKASANSGAEIILGKNIIDIYGTQSQTKQAYQELVRQTEVVKIRDTKFQIELSAEHKDFINGKKNGKINRITKTSGCRIAFQESSDVNMLIDVYSASPSCLLSGVAMLEEELPAEMSFYIPETYHKRIIGVGGKNIQKIMKRFGVYVKFSNTEEYEQLGGYYENVDNVICRTPSKNQENLRDLKFSIVEAVNATDLLETIEIIDSLPRQFSQFYCGLNGENILNIDRDLRVRVCLPDNETGSDRIILAGPEGNIEIAKKRLSVLTV